MNNDTEAADKLRLNYYYGKDIEVPDENGRIVGIIHSADTDPVIRDKLFQNMLTSSKRAPFNNEYRAQYLADFNRLASGLMKSDGSLDLEENEFYYFEIIGCSVKSTTGEEIGEITEILETGANDVWVVKRKGHLN